MKKVCNECKEIYMEHELECPECFNEESILIREEDICPICELCHDHGATGNYKCNDFEDCFIAAYSDGMALQYIEEVYSESEKADWREWMREPYMKRTLQSYMWSLDVEHIKEFMQFVADSESEKKVAHIWLYALVATA